MNNTTHMKFESNSVVFCKNKLILLACFIVAQYQNTEHWIGIFFKM